MQKKFKKLSLNKKTISSLTEEQMNNVKGGEEAGTSRRNCTKILCGSSRSGGPVCLCPHSDDSNKN